MTWAATVACVLCVIVAFIADDRAYRTGDRRWVAACAVATAAAAVFMVAAVLRVVTL